MPPSHGRPFQRERPTRRGRRCSRTSSPSSVAAVSPPASLSGAVPRPAHISRTASLWRLVLLVALCGVWGWPERVLAADAAEPPPPIQILPQDGFNLTVEDQINAHYVVVALTSPAHNWFAGTFTQLPTDQDVTIGLSLTGNDTKGNTADVRKWQGLAPVMTYADPAQYATYEWFRKDQEGRWVSGDPFKQGEAKFAGTGKVPVQSVIPTDVAAQFLSADGTSWHAWREVDKAEAVANLNIFRIKQRFVYPTATVTMRIPFTYTYQQSLISHILSAKRPGVFIDKLGGTPERRRLQVIRLEDPTSQVPPKERKTVVMVAREHATEASSSWVVFGALSTLLSDRPEAQRLRKDTTWLLIPIQDPDGSANAVFDRLTAGFLRPHDPHLPPEILAYARYFTNYVANGRTIDLTVSLHNVEASECMNVFCPFRDEEHDATIRAFNRLFFTDLTARGYTVNNPEAAWGTGVVPARLYGWCAARFGSIDFCYEVNDRYPSRRLSLPELQGIGGSLARHIAHWLASDDGQRLHTALLRRGEGHRQARAAYYQEPGRQVNARTPYELLILGY